LDKSYDSLEVKTPGNKQRRPHTAVNGRKLTKSYQGIHSIQKNSSNVTELNPNKSQKYVSKLGEGIKPHKNREMKM
jgi:hypothetical protein